MYLIYIYVKYETVSLLTSPMTGYCVCKAFLSKIFLAEMPTKRNSLVTQLVRYHAEEPDLGVPSCYRFCLACIAFALQPLKTIHAN